MTRLITGDKALDRKLQMLQGRAIKRVTRNSIRAGLRVVAKSIKSEVPSSMKEAKKGIGSRFSRTRVGAGKGITSAIVGAGVGISFKRARKAAQGRSRPGVGIGARNIHWWILGTAARRHKSGKGTGRMPPGKPVVKLGLAKSQGAAMAKIKGNLIKGIEREARKK